MGNNIYLHKLIINMKQKEDKMIKSNGDWYPVGEVIENFVKKKKYELEQFIQQSKKGDVHEYYKGFLAKDCEMAQGTEIRKLGSYARNLEARNIISLVQKRLAPEEFSYMAVKR
tara:strand:+ start:377 stop:718 length:342 start_codon:yes stop_codon:yes gene_type:complete